MENTCRESLISAKIMNPKVSIITTVYNCEKYISKSIESILNQTYENFEFIILNDGSNDGTGDIISKYSSEDSRIKLISSESNIGRVSSLNKSIETSKGKYIALQDADDISKPDRIEKQLNFLEDNPEYVLVGSDVSVIDKSGKTISRPVRPVHNNELQFSLLFRCTFANPSIMFRKRILSENGIDYEKEYEHAEDYRIISKISKHGKIHNLNEVLINYRKHPRNNSLVNANLLNQRSALITAENISELGIRISTDEAMRIRQLISSRGMTAAHHYKDLKLLFRIVQAFQKLHKEEGLNKEAARLLKRMMNWIGKKNIMTNPNYTRLFFSILTYYSKAFILLKK